MSPEEIREALAGNIWIDPGINAEYARLMSQRLGVLKEAARAYADLLEKGPADYPPDREARMAPRRAGAPGIVGAPLARTLSER